MPTPTNTLSIQEKFQTLRDQAERIKRERELAIKQGRPHIEWPKKDPEKTKLAVERLLKFFYEGRNPRTIPDELAMRFAAKNSRFVGPEQQGTPISRAKSELDRTIKISLTNALNRSI